MQATPPPASHAATTTDARPPALVPWRLLSLFYDLWPVVALWMLVAIPFVLADVAMSGGDTRHNIKPFSLMAWMEWTACWLVTGLYATISWRRGGQTLGMRPWRLKLQGGDGGAPSWRALWLRYAVGTVSLLAAGLGFWWALFDRERLAWHDRASATRLVRLPKRKK